MQLTVSQAFGALRAEDEPWLEHCFIAPADFERIVSNRSEVIFGSIGSGKTALYETIKRQNVGPTGEPIRLLIDWRIGTPAVIDPERASSVVRNQVQHLFDLCAVQLATHIAHFPTQFAAAPEWVQQRINWFVQAYVRDRPEIRLGHLVDRNLPGSSILRLLLATKPPGILHPDAAPQETIDELTIGLEQIGLQGVWFLVDDIEGHAHNDEKLMLEMFQALLGTLPLFEKSGFAFKLFVPERFEGVISRTSGFERRRISGIRLRLTPLELQRIVNRRLQLVTGDADFHLGRLYLEDEIVAWLQAVGAESPRHWIDQVYPLISYYVANNLDRILTKKEWNSLRQNYPPRFYFDSEKKSVIVGGRVMTLDEVPPNAIDMLAYLFDHSKEIVSREELYFLAYKSGNRRIPVAGEPDYESPNDYRGALDTALWRLRNAIEPDPKFPVLLETKRGHGVVLHVRF